MMNVEKMMALNAFAKVYAKEEELRIFDEFAELRGEKETTRPEHYFDCNAELIMSSLEIAGCDITRIAIAMNIVDNWYLFFKTVSSNAETVVQNAYNTMVTLYKSTPEEYFVFNLNEERALKLGFKKSETANVYKIPVWYWNIIFDDEELFDENGNLIGLKEDVKELETEGLYYPFYLKF